MKASLVGCFDIASRLFLSQSLRKLKTLTANAQRAQWFKNKKGSCFSSRSSRLRGSSLYVLVFRFEAEA
jgi:hypothetical protein